MSWILTHLGMLITLIRTFVVLVEDIAGEAAGTVKKATVVQMVMDFVTSKLHPPTSIATLVEDVVAAINDAIVYLLNKFQPGWTSRTANAEPAPAVNPATAVTVAATSASAAKASDAAHATPAAPAAPAAPTAPAASAAPVATAADPTPRVG